MKANASPQLVKYVIPVLEKERQGKSEAEIDRRLTALIVIGKVRDESLTPLVVKELQNYSDKRTMYSCLLILAELADEQAYDLFLKSLSQYIKKYFETVKGQASSTLEFFTGSWPYFQKLDRGRAPEVIALLHRLAKPQVWQWVSEPDREMFEEQYKDLAIFQDSHTLRQRLADIYRDESRPMPERVSAFNELLDTFRNGTREEIVRRYITPESEAVEQQNIWLDFHGAELKVSAPDGSKYRIRINRSEKRNSVVGVNK